MIPLWGSRCQVVLARAHVDHSAGNQRGTFKDPVARKVQILQKIKSQKHVSTFAIEGFVQSKQHVLPRSK